MNNKSNTVKTILFASLIVAMILPFSTMNVAEAKNIEKTNYNQIKKAEKIAKNEQEIKRYEQKALRDKKIPDSKLLDRLGDRWISQYSDVEEFNHTQKASKSYVDGEYQQNGWNEKMVKNHISISNFETIIGKVGQGHEMVLLVAESEKLQGQYNPPDPVKKFHDWLASQYEIPNTTQGIHERLLDIVDDDKYLNLAIKTANHFNNQAEHGNVPYTLFNSDVDYWVMVANVSMCEYDSQCNAEKLRDGQTNITLEELKELQSIEEIVPISTGIWEYILPEAAAWSKVYVNYNLYTYMSASSCYYDDCFRSYSENNSNGSEEIDVDSFTTTGGETQHTSRGKTLYYYASACDTYSGSKTVINKATVTPYLSQQLETSKSDSGTNYNSCAIASSLFTATAPWIYGVNAKSSGSYYWVS